MDYMSGDINQSLRSYSNNIVLCITWLV